MDSLADLVLLHASHLRGDWEWVGIWKRSGVSRAVWLGVGLGQGQGQSSVF